MRIVNLIVVLFLLSSVYSITPITSCQDINSPGEYVLLNDVSISGDTCFSINTDDVILNCNGHRITGDSTYKKYGVSIYKKDNVKVLNCNIAKFYYNIYSSKSSNLLFENISLVQADKHGAYITTCQNVTFDGLTMALNSEDGVRIGGTPDASFYHVIGNRSGDAVGIEATYCDNLYVEDYNSSQGHRTLLVEDSDYIQLKSIYSSEDVYGIIGKDLRYPLIEDYTAKTLSHKAIWLSDDDGVGIQNAIIRDVSVSTISNDNAIVVSNAPNLIMEGVSVKNCQKDGSISISHAVNAQIKDISVSFSSGGNGLTLVDSNNTYVNNVTVNGSGEYGISIGEAHGISVANVSIRNTADLGVYVHELNSSEFENMFIYGAGHEGVKLSGSFYNTFYNISTIHNNYTGFSFSFGSSYNNLTLLNSTLNKQNGLVFYYAEHNIVQNASVTFNYENGVEFDINCPYNLVANSTISNNVVCAIQPITGCGSSKDKYGNVWFYNTFSGIVADSIISNSYSYGIRMAYDNGTNIITRNHIINNSDFGIRWSNDYPDLIYDNFFNNTYNVPDSGYGNDTWNTSLHSGTNIVGGSLIGGNFWAKPDGTGFSETCADTDMNGICDASYSLSSYDIDYYPLTYPNNLTTSSGCLIFVPPTPDNDTFLYNQTYLPVNITNASEYNYTLAVINLYNYSAFNSSYSCTTLPCFNNFTNLEDGVYYIVGELYLTNGSVCESEVRTIGISNSAGSFQCDLLT